MPATSPPVKQASQDRCFLLRLPTLLHQERNPVDKAHIIAMINISPQPLRHLYYLDPQGILNDRAR